MKDFVVLTQAREGLIGEDIYIRKDRILSFTRGQSGATEIFMGDSNGIAQGFSVSESVKKVRKLIEKD